MEEKYCPLCKSTNHKNIEEISRFDLISRYKKIIDFDISYLVSQDIKYLKCLNCSIYFFHPFFTGDEKFYNSLQKKEWYYMKEKFEYEIASHYIKEKNLVIDVGCGNGNFSKFVETKGGEFIGLDFSKNAFEMAKQNKTRILNISVHDYSEENKETADIVSSFQVCEHISDLKEFIESKINLLKKGGKMIIAVPSNDSFMGTNSNGILNMPPHHITRWPDEVFKYISTNYNLILEEIIHEKLQDQQYKLYLNNFFQNKFLKPRLVDNSFLRRVFSFIGHFFSSFFYKLFKPSDKLYGHTVIAIFKK